MRWLRPLGLALFWCAQWLAFVLTIEHGCPPWLAFALATCAGLWLVRRAADRTWAGLMRPLAFPASVCLTLSPIAVPSWVWLIALVIGAILYPRLDKKDAPLWRAPADLGSALARLLPQSPQVVLDAGCGLGDALVQFSRHWPAAQLRGIEISPLMRWICRQRLKSARIEAGDMWQLSWSGADLVYLFLRPEAMGDAQTKCLRDLAGTALVAALDFPLAASALASCRLASGKTLWLYRVAELAAPDRVLTPD